MKANMKNPEWQKACDSARKAGAKTFSYEGKTYSTKDESEMPAKAAPEAAKPAGKTRYETAEGQQKAAMEYDEAWKQD